MLLFSPLVRRPIAPVDSCLHLRHPLHLHHLHCRLPLLLLAAHVLVLQAGKQRGRIRGCRSTTVDGDGAGAVGPAATLVWIHSKAIQRNPNMKSR